MADNPEQKVSESLEFETPLEDEFEDEIDSKSKQIFTDQSDPEIDSLIRRIKKGSLVLQPDFQRYYVWDDVKASRLIESALLEIPLPTIYLSEEKDGRVYVIDGQQRLTAFVSFIDGKLPDNRDFKLKGLKVFTELIGKKFVELDSILQDKITGYSVRTITFKKESGKDLKFEIFERLNTGSVSLNDQELRNCIYRGAYNKKLKVLSVDPDFQYLLNISKPDTRMGDIELVLRFAAFYHNTYLNYKPPMKKFLSSEMERYQDISDNDSNELEASFKNSVMIIRSLLDKNAFKRFYKGKEGNHDGYWEPKRFNASLYDVLMYTFAKQDKNTVYQHMDSIRESFIDLMCSDQEFIDSIELSTSSIQAVTKRFDKLRLSLQDIVGINTKEPRLFTYQLKEALFKQNQTCAICQQRILSIDDSAVDHIEMYWKGGKTISENARLTHRYCNWARSKKDTDNKANVILPVAGAEDLPIGPGMSEKSNQGDLSGENSKTIERFTNYCKSIYDNLLETMEHQFAPNKRSRHAWTDQWGSRGFSLWFGNSIWANGKLQYFLYYYEADPDIKTSGKISIVLSVSPKYLLDKKTSQKQIETLKSFMKGYKKQEFNCDDLEDFLCIEKYIGKFDYSNTQRLAVTEAMKALIKDTKQKIEELIA